MKMVNDTNKYTRVEIASGFVGIEYHIVSNVKNKGFPTLLVDHLCWGTVGSMPVSALMKFDMRGMCRENCIPISNDVQASEIRL